VDIESAWDILGMEENECRGFMKGLPSGKKYLLSRKELNAITAQRTKI
jgi:hypothetical protein